MSADVDTRWRQITDDIAAVRALLGQNSQFEPGGEATAWRLLKAEADLYEELDALQEACGHPVLAPEGFIAHHGPCPDCGKYYPSLYGEEGWGLTKEENNDGGADTRD